MIESGFRPVTLIVAVRALLTVGAVMHVVKCMTAVTGDRCFRITLIDMAGITGCVLVFALQAEISFVVIKPDLRP